MIGLLAFLLRVAVLLVFTFGFVVLYEHGPEDYLQNACDEGKAVWQWGQGEVSSRFQSPPVSEPLPSPEPTPTPTPTPEPSPEPTPTPAPTASPSEPSSTAPESWRTLQDTPIGEIRGPKPLKQSP